MTKKIILILLITLSCLIKVYSQDYFWTENKTTDTTQIIRNIISVFPSKATKINGFCFTLSHNQTRSINGLNLEFPGARFTEYFIYQLSRDIYPERFATVNGLTISFNPIYEKVSGVGIFAFVPEIYEFNGLIIGPFNSVKVY